MSDTITAQPVKTPFFTPETIRSLDELREEMERLKKLSDALLEPLFDLAHIDREGELDDAVRTHSAVSVDEARTSIERSLLGQDSLGVPCEIIPPQEKKIPPPMLSELVRTITREVTNLNSQLETGSTLARHADVVFTEVERVSGLTHETF